MTSVVRTFYFGDRKMDIYRVSFFGHRTLYDIVSVQKKIESAVKELLKQKEYVEFYVGRNGDFDISAASAVKQVQKTVGNHNCSLILVLPYHVKDEVYYESFYDEILLPIDSKTHFKSAITKRNQWMIDNSELLIAYIEHPSGGAYKAMKYAEEKNVPVFNIAS